MVYEDLRARYPEAELAGRILLGVSGTPPAWRAVEHAIDLARLTGAPLLAVHVVNSQAAFRTGIYYRNALRELSADGARVLERVKSAAQSQGVEVLVLQVHGPPAEALVNVANSVNPRLIVLYKEPTSLLEVFLRKNVPEQVSSRVKCPIYLVGPADAGSLRAHIVEQPARGSA